MSERRSHKITANRLANMRSAEYNHGKGPDVKTNSITIKVETPESDADIGRQLSGHQGTAYVRGTNKEAVEEDAQDGPPSSFLRRGEAACAGWRTPITSTFEARRAFSTGCGSTAPSYSRILTGR